MKVPPYLGSRVRCLATYSEAPFNALPLPLTDGISYVLCRASTNRALTQLPSSYQVVLRKQESFLAEDDRVIAEDSTSWNLQCGMDLYHRGSRLQLGPLAESGDSSDIGPGEVRPLSWTRAFWAASGYSQGSSLSHKITKLHETRRGSKSYHPFFCSLLERFRKYGEVQCDIDGIPKRSHYARVAPME
jgi:hypothetical protein